MRTIKFSWNLYKCQKLSWLDSWQYVLDLLLMTSILEISRVEENIDKKIFIGKSKIKIGKKLNLMFVHLSLNRKSSNIVYGIFMVVLKDS